MRLNEERFNCSNTTEMISQYDVRFWPINPLLIVVIFVDKCAL